MSNFFSGVGLWSRRFLPAAAAAATCAFAPPAAAEQDAWCPEERSEADVERLFAYMRDHVDGADGLLDPEDHAAYLGFIESGNCIEAEQLVEEAYQLAHPAHACFFEVTGDFRDDFESIEREAQAIGRHAGWEFAASSTHYPELGLCLVERNYEDARKEAVRQGLDLPQNPGFGARGDYAGEKPPMVLRDRDQAIARIVILCSYLSYLPACLSIIRLVHEDETVKISDEDLYSDLAFARLTGSENQLLQEKPPLPAGIEARADAALAEIARRLPPGRAEEIDRDVRTDIAELERSAGEPPVP